MKTREVWMIEELSTGRSRWTRIGTADEKSDGSYTVNLQAAPIPGARLNIRPQPTVTAADVDNATADDGVAR